MFRLEDKSIIVIAFFHSKDGDPLGEVSAQKSSAQIIKNFPMKNPTLGVDSDTSDKTVYD